MLDLLHGGLMGYKKWSGLRDYDCELRFDRCQSSESNTVCMVLPQSHEGWWFNRRIEIYMYGNDKRIPFLRLCTGARYFYSMCRPTNHRSTCWWLVCLFCAIIVKKHFVEKWYLPFLLLHTLSFFATCNAFVSCNCFPDRRFWRKGERTDWIQKWKLIHDDSSNSCSARRTYWPCCKVLRLHVSEPCIGW